MLREWKTVEYSALLVPLNHTLYLRGSGIIVKEASGKIVRTRRTGCARYDSTIAHSELPVVVVACIRFTQKQTSQSQHGWGQVWWSSPTSLGAIGHWWMLREGESGFVCFSFFLFHDAALESFRSSFHTYPSIPSELSGKRNGLIKTYLYTCMKFLNNKRLLHTWLRKHCRRKGRN